MAKNLKDVANQYAKAIFDLSSDHQIVDETLADLRAIKAVLA
ncbi:MAG: F0F1 ATP synthase subunit delta, partial [Leuconostoc lactis]